MTVEQKPSGSPDPVGDMETPVVNPKKKKASWLRTILWMLSMIVLANMVMAILAYFLFFRNK